MMAASGCLSTTDSTDSTAPVDVSQLTVGILGGTGPQGRGLGLRLAAAGQRVLLGSREPERASEVADSARSAAAADADVSVTGGTNADVAEVADLIIVAVIGCVVPMAFDERGAYVLEVPEGSVTQQAAAVLPGSTVVGAFHHLSAVLLEDMSRASIDADVMVVGDDREATDKVQALADRLPGMRGVYAGRLRNARQVEALTINLVSINRRYKAHAGIRITDV
jgi:predicted dinucleotide-binding enzyme